MKGHNSVLPLMSYIVLTVTQLEGISDEIRLFIWYDDFYVTTVSRLTVPSGLEPHRGCQQS